MLVDVKYREGDIVRFKHRQIVTTTCTCSFCGATGIVKGMDGTSDECPRCDGTGYQEIKTAQDSVSEGTIQRIKIFWPQRQEEPVVQYVMSGFNWSQTDIPQEDIEEKIGEWDPYVRTNIYST